jgi:hypothetical protein
MTHEPQMPAETYGLFTKGEITQEQYFKLPHINSSGLRTFSKRTPAHFYYEKNKVSNRLSTPAQILGSAIHCFILEGDEFFKRYHVMDTEVDRRTTAGKDAYKLAALSGKIVLSLHEAEVIRGISNGVKMHTPLMDMLSTAHKEAVALWQDPVAVTDCKAKFDAILSNGDLLDIKTTAGDGKGIKDASSSSFSKAIVNYGLNMQAAFYMEGYRHATGKTPEWFYWAVIEKEPPYAIALYRVAYTSQLIQESIAFNERQLLKYDDCLRSNIWPGFSKEAQAIDMPIWAYTNLQEDGSIL